MDANQTGSIFTPTTIALTIAVIVIIIGLIRYGFGDKKNQSSETQSFSPSPSPSVSMGTTVTPPEPTAIVGVLPRDKFIDQIREERKSGKPLKDYFKDVAKGFEDSLSTDEALNACLSLDFEDTEIAPLLDVLGYTPCEIAEKIEADYSPSSEEWLALLLPFSKAEDQPGKCREVIEAIEYAGIDIDSDFIEPLTKQGITEAEAIKIVYEKSSQTLWEILDGTEIESDPSRLVEVAKQCEVDLSESEEYEKLRERIDFDKAIIVLQGFGKSLAEIIDIENGDNTIEDDALKGILKDLKSADYSTVEILVALFGDQDTEVYLSGIVGALTDEVISEDEFIAFALASETDPADIDSEFNEQEVELKVSSRVLHRLFTAIDEKAEQSASLQNQT
ncbi:MAG: hypothetical protein G01um101420_578 [Parcubacteria group bacterium Gr01-1014_20]|nr:MAG: hypothetical protein G01um101420_578 [Parcubacteria group bacterium Gr01-1014_20]